MKRLAEQLGLVLLICLGVRIGAKLISDGVLSTLAGVVVVVAVVAWLSGRVGGGRGGYR